jgi:hypothetical protein
MDFQLPILLHPNVLSSWNNNAIFHLKIIKYENHCGIFVVPISNVHFLVLTHGIPNINHVTNFEPFNHLLIMTKECNVCDLTLPLNHNHYINGHWLNTCDILKKTCCFLPTNIIDNISKWGKI